MGGITSGIGIFSGIDTRSLINQLIAIESRPRAAAQIRLTTLNSQQAAVLDINSRLLSLATAAKSLRIENVFNAARAESSNGSVITATAGRNATLGSFNFVVNRLVSTDQRISRGFTDRDTSGLGLTELSLEVGGGRVDSSTSLAELNGGTGVDRGKIRITDADGATAEVDLSTAASIDDVLDAINSASGLNVSAKADGFGLRIENVQKIENVFGSQTATSLGIAKTAVGGVVAGDSVLRLSESTPLSLLRDGAGVAFLADAGNRSLSTPVPDFQIAVAGGGTHSIVLGKIVEDDPDPDAEEGATVVVQNAAATLGDLFSIIESSTGGEVTAALSADGTRIELSSAIGDVSVLEGPTARPTARNLGLLGQPAGPTLSSVRLLAGLNSTLVSSLKGGSGLTAGDLSITTRDGSVFALNLDTDASVSDLIAAIESGTTGAVTASLNKSGNGLILTDTTTGGTTFGLSGGAADGLGLTGSFAAGVADSGNLQSKYISEGTLLSTLNAGAGIGTGSFRITDSTGTTSTITLGSEDKTVFDLIRRINGAGVNANARINDTGDGIVIEDDAAGTLALKIEDVTGRVARGLNLIGEGDPGDGNKVDGSFERTITFDATDTLDQVVNKINAAGAGAQASVVNDGFGVSPFRIVLTSRTSGEIGKLTIDSQGADLGLSQLTRARDAVVFFGSTNPADAILLTSSTNTVEGAIGGVSLDLRSTSATPVEINISRDTAKIEESINSFIESFNGVIDRVRFHGRFNSETEERGALLGDGLIQQVERELQNTVRSEGLDVQGQFGFLFQVGIRTGDQGKLEFDAEAFRTALAQDPAGVADLFSAFAQERVEPEEIAPGVTVNNAPTEIVSTRLGVLEVLAELSERFTDSVDGVLTRRKNTFDTQIRLQQGRITAFDVQLDSKRVRLERQFASMEQALAQLQAQQSALGSLSLIG